MPLSIGNLLQALRVPDPASYLFSTNATGFSGTKRWKYVGHIVGRRMPANPNLGQ